MGKKEAGRDCLGGELESGWMLAWPDSRVAIATGNPIFFEWDSLSAWYCTTNIVR
jgi:hypothetical protein